LLDTQALHAKALLSARATRDLNEGVGIVEEIGKEVRNLFPSDRVVIPSTIACGYCSYCRDG
jgi:threonine dehydrogenase-like Zn-dependent dehydrogenase